MENSPRNIRGNTDIFTVWSAAEADLPLSRGASPCRHHARARIVTQPEIHVDLEAVTEQGPTSRCTSVSGLTTMIL